MLVSILSSCLLCAVAQAVMPKGPVRGVGKLVCALVMLCALLASAAKLRPGVNTRWLETYLAEFGQNPDVLEETLRREWKTVIEENYGAYISDKAAEFGLHGSVDVVCEETQDGIYLPTCVVISGVPEGEGREALNSYLEQEWNMIPSYTQEAVG